MVKHIRILFLSNFLYGLVFYVPILALFLLDNNITLPIIIYGQTIYSVAAFLSEIPSGVVADRFGHNKSISFGYFLNTIAMVLIAAFPSISMLFVFQIIRGIAGGLLSGSKEALLYEYDQQEERNFKKDLSHLVSYNMAGFSASTLITGIVISQLGAPSYRYMIMATSVAFALATAASLKLPFSKQERSAAAAQLEELKESIMLFKKNKILKILFIVVALTYGGKYLLIDLYQPYFVEYSVEPFFIGFALSIGSLFSFFLLRNIYKIEKPLGGSRAALGLVAATTGMLYILFGQVSNPYMLVPIFVALFGFTETVSIFISDYANKHAPSHIRATVLSTVGLSQEVFKASYKIVFAIAVGVFSLSQVFTAYGVYLIIGAFISYLLLGANEKIKE